jgi:hypothetical protein
MLVENPELCGDDKKHQQQPSDVREGCEIQIWEDAAGGCGGFRDAMHVLLETQRRFGIKSYAFERM